MRSITISRMKDPNYTIEVEYDVSNNPIYVGESKPGTNTVDLRWRIRRINYDAANNPLNVVWAEGNGNFDKAWSLRHGYTYS